MTSPNCLANSANSSVKSMQSNQNLKWIEIEQRGPGEMLIRTQKKRYFVKLHEFSPFSKKGGYIFLGCEPMYQVWEIDATEHIVDLVGDGVSIRKSMLIETILRYEKSKTILGKLRNTIDRLLNRASSIWITIRYCIVTRITNEAKCHLDRLSK